MRINNDGLFVLMKVFSVLYFYNRLIFRRKKEVQGGKENEKGNRE